MTTLDPASLPAGADVVPVLHPRASRLDLVRVWADASHVTLLGATCAGCGSLMTAAGLVRDRRVRGGRRLLCYPCMADRNHLRDLVAMRDAARARRARRRAAAVGA